LKSTRQSINREKEVHMPQIADYRLLVNAQEETPAWEIPLRAGQSYIGLDQKDGGGVTLIFDLGDYSGPSRDQVDYLDRHNLSYHVAPGWAVNDLRPFTTEVIDR
jgi:hypothetical protein